MKLEDIYKKEVLKDGELLPEIQPRVVRDPDHVPGMSNGSCLMGAEMNIKDEPEDYDVDLKSSVSNRDGNSDDLGFDDTTLEQIRKQCKANKRKRHDHTITNTVTMKSESDVKEEYLIFWPEDEGCGLEDPLVRWKSKFTKRRKGKKKLKVKCGSSLSPINRCEDLLVACDVKIEDCEHSLPIREVPTSSLTESLQGCIEKPNSSAIPTTNLEEEVMNVSTGRAPFDVNEPSSEFQDSTSVVDKAAFGYQGNMETENLLDVNFSGEKTTMVDSSEGTNPQNSEFPIAESGNDVCLNDTISANTSSECEAEYEYVESIDPKPEFCGNVTGWEIVKVESPEILAIEYPVFPEMDFGAEKTMIRQLSCEFTCNLDRSELMCSADHSFLLTNPRCQVQEFDVAHIDHGLQCLDLSNAERSSCKTEDVVEDYLNNIPRAIAIRPSARDSSYSDPDDCMVSAEEDHLPTKRQSESSEHADSAEDCKSVRPCNASGEAKLASETFIVQNKKSRCPEKLFSGRKVISPASQEKLRKALRHPDSPEKSKCKGKLYLSSQNAHRILKAEGLDNIERAEVSPNAKQTIQTPNNSRQTQRQKKATSKIPRSNIEAATTTPRFSTGCNSVHVCSQNAIAFTQRQMHDFQNLASKLMNELNVMKEIMKGYQQNEGSPSKSPRCNMDEVKIAIGSAGRTEETARKWLSIMERDCNRFCKLMDMTQEGSSASENVAQKKRKKITFADHAGGDLCHVKVFEKDAESSSQLENESDPR